MSEQSLPYIQRKAGDPWTVEDFHDVQKMVKDDIHDSIQSAVDQIERVDKAGDAENFGGQNPEEYAKALIDRILAILPSRTGYMMLFKYLKLNEETVVEHKLGAFPLVDLYQLIYFRAIASEDGHIYETFTTFYLYHSGESKIRFRPEETPDRRAVSLSIDPEDGHAYRIPFERLLQLYYVAYDDDTSLGDLENDFWNAFLTDPNDEFDDDQYCHSPWFDRCCQEHRTVRSLKQRGEWDDIYFQVRPRKTTNYDHDVPSTGEIPDNAWTPNNIQVVHFDLNTAGLMLLKAPDLPNSQTGGGDGTTPSYNSPDFPNIDAIQADHIKVMALLKV